MTSENQLKQNRAVGLRLRNARREKLMLQDELARATGLSKQELSGYEKGIIKIPHKVLYELSIMLEKPVSWFFNNIETASKTAEQLAEDDYDECVFYLKELRKQGDLGHIRDILHLALFGKP